MLKNVTSNKNCEKISQSVKKVGRKWPNGLVSNQDFALQFFLDSLFSIQIIE